MGEKDLPIFVFHKAKMRLTSQPQYPMDITTITRPRDVNPMTYLPSTSRTLRRYIICRLLRISQTSTNKKILSTKRYHHCLSLQNRSNKKWEAVIGPSLALTANYLLCAIPVIWLNRA